MKSSRFFLASFVFFEFLDATGATSAHAYIGPGAGFAFLSSFLVLVITFILAFFYLLSWPIRFALKGLRHRRPRTAGQSQVRRIIVVGLDGMDPKLADQFMAEGKLPNFEKLKKMGSFRPLSTSYPSISPVAWSSFMTGVDPSSHNIFDFLTRDPCTYRPMLSSAEIGKASKVLPLGRYMIPMGKPKIKLLRKSKPFWSILGERGIFSSIIRVPITFPPEPFNGVLLSGMCTPDLRGSQGTFSFYTTDANDRRGETGGVRYHVAVQDDVIHAHLYGPDNGLVRNGGALTVPVRIRLDKQRTAAVIEIGAQRIHLPPKTYSPWVRVTFRPGLGMKIRGICLFYINKISPEFEMYVSPIHIDPENPALPISHPFVYAVYLAKLLGPYGTLGLAEDTWALNEGVIDEEAFLKQAYLLCEERERMFFKALENTATGLCACVFDTTDRVQHMFFRFLDDAHPANRGREVGRYKTVIEDLYTRMDALVGRVLDKLDEKTILMIMSDHGFTQFKRGVNLNSWLFRNGYLTLKGNAVASGEWFEGVDWEKTKAFSLGLTGLFLNRRGREACGIVEEGEDATNLKRELIAKLTGLKDDDTGETAVREVVDTSEAFDGPYLHDAPDLLIGYAAGYRNSWDCVTGRVTDLVFEDNTKRWSGDHCVDPKIVPGVLFTNRPINTDNPDIKDIAPTVLSLFGVDRPAYMKGRVLIGPAGGPDVFPREESVIPHETRDRTVESR